MQFERVEFLHSKGYVFRDTKPENFLMGIGRKSSILYMIDFGLSTSYIDQRINLHKPYR
jgi:serine/threonine protein kinase